MDISVLFRSRFFSGTLNRFGCRLGFGFLNHSWLCRCSRNNRGLSSKCADCKYTSSQSKNDFFHVQSPNVQSPADSNKPFLVLLVDAHTTASERDKLTSKSRFC